MISVQRGAELSSLDGDLGMISFGLFVSFHPKVPIKYCGIQQDLQA